MLDARDRHVTNTGGRRHALAQADLDAPQRHALSLPVREGPRQRQGKLLPRDLTVRVRGDGRRAEHRHPLPPRRLIRKKRSLATRLVSAQLHVIELHEHAQRNGLRRVLTPRVEAFREREAADPTQRAIHEAGLDPLVVRQQHTRADTEAQLRGQTLELLIVHLLGLDTLRSLVKSPDAQNRVLSSGQLTQALLVVMIRAVLAAHGGLLPIEKHGRILELPLELLTAQLRRIQLAEIALRKPRMVLP